MSYDFKQICAPGWDEPVPTIASNGTMTVGSCGHFCEACSRRDYRIKELEKQLAERDAALARCVEALQKASYALFQIKRMVPEAIKEHASKACDESCDVLNTLPTSTQATAKVLAAARACAVLWESYERGDRERDDLEMEEAEVVLRSAVREEQEGK